jgi:hypothetical protein
MWTFSRILFGKVVAFSMKSMWTINREVTVQRDVAYFMAKWCQLVSAAALICLGIAGIQSHRLPPSKILRNSPWLRVDVGNWHRRMHKAFDFVDSECDSFPMLQMSFLSAFDDCPTNESISEELVSGLAVRTPEICYYHPKIYYIPLYNSLVLSCMERDSELMLDFRLFNSSPGRRRHLSRTRSQKWDQRHAPQSSHIEDYHS